MKKHTKRALAVLMAVMMLLSAVPFAGFAGLEMPELGIQAQAAQATDPSLFGYSIDTENNYVTITGYNVGLSGDIVIPDTINGLPVKVIGSDAFQNATITGVVIPDSVTSIGSNAFRSCSSLTSVTIGNGVTSIGSYAFTECSNLESITIPNSVTSIGSSAFSWCSRLTSVTIDNGVTSIGSGAFESCDSLLSVNITNLSSWCKIGFLDHCSNPLYRGGNLYLNNELVTELVIPDDVTSIKNYAFYNCKSITSLTVPDSVEVIDYSAFSGCTNLVNAIIGNSVRSIADSAFYGCSKLASVSLPESVTSIGTQCFKNCISLTGIEFKNPQCTIPSSSDTISPTREPITNLFRRFRVCIMLQQADIMIPMLNYLIPT